MKKLTFLAFAIVIGGCHHSEFDVSPEQVAKKLPKRGGMPGGPPDLGHLPPGAVKHEHTYHKGDTLPDGSIADGDRHVVSVEMKGSKGAPGGMENRRMEMVDANIKEGK